MNITSRGRLSVVVAAARCALLAVMALGLVVGLAAPASALPSAERKTCAVRVLNTAELLARHDTDYAGAARDDDAKGRYRLDNGMAGPSWVFQLNRGDQVRVRYGVRLNPNEEGLRMRQLEGGAWVANSALSGPFNCYE